MAKQRRFMGRPIAKETINLGVGGQLVREDDFPQIPPRAEVTFKATAKFENIKHKFTDHGTVEEAMIFTIDASTFEVLSIEEVPEQEQIPGTEAGGAGNVTELPDRDPEPAMD